MQSDDLIGNSNATNSEVVRSITGSPVFPDDGALHMYTFTWHPNYIELLCDGVRI
jgi:beta-glucanase (GH16 family)